MVGVCGGVVVAADGDGQCGHAAEQVGRGKADQPGPGRPLDSAAHCRRHATMRQYDDRHHVADHPERAEYRHHDGRYGGLEPIQSGILRRLWKNAGVDYGCRC